RRKWTEFLPELDLQVNQVAHVRAPRIRKDAAIAERAGAPLHPPLKPADNVSIGDQASRGPAHLGIGVNGINGISRIEAKNLYRIGVNISIKERCDITIVVGGTPERVIHKERTG